MWKEPLLRASLVYWGSVSAWPAPDAGGAQGGSCPPSGKVASSLVPSPSGWSCADASWTEGEGSSELASLSPSGDRGRQWSGMASSDDGSGSGPEHSGFCSITGCSSPGKQMTARYQ